ncbi:hypothetical protein AYI68_g7748 [Smittium mucronatum]|uniref:Uncharacterized protein n=1 Tax=Smittium mucronatum TaxID=133383 RepID=A0A1R0GMV4_9FUNG|nr:hypothetical protein AYI68_g7748 [Smittium mucronatum]
MDLEFKNNTLKKKNYEKPKQIDHLNSKFIDIDEKASLSNHVQLVEGNRKHPNRKINYQSNLSFGCSVNSISSNLKKLPSDYDIKCSSINEKSASLHNSDMTIGSQIGKIKRFRNFSSRKNVSSECDRNSMKKCKRSFSKTQHQQFRSYINLAAQHSPEGSIFSNGINFTESSFTNNSDRSYGKLSECKILSRFTELNLSPPSSSVSMRKWGHDKRSVSSRFKSTRKDSSAIRRQKRLPSVVLRAFRSKRIPSICNDSNNETIGSILENANIFSSTKDFTPIKERSKFEFPVENFHSQTINEEHSNRKSSEILDKIKPLRSYSLQRARFYSDLLDEESNISSTQLNGFDCEAIDCSGTLSENSLISNFELTNQWDKSISTDYNFDRKYSLFDSVIVKNPEYLYSENKELQNTIAHNSLGYEESPIRGSTMDEIIKGIATKTKDCVNKFCDVVESNLIPDNANFGVLAVEGISNQLKNLKFKCADFVISKKPVLVKLSSTPTAKAIVSQVSDGIENFKRIPIAGLLITGAVNKCPESMYWALGNNNNHDKQD